MKKEKLKRYKVSWVLSWIFLSVSILMILYIFWQSETQLSSFFYGHYTGYYIASFFITFFWIAVLFLKDKIRYKIVMTTVIVLSSLYALEILLYFYIHGKGVDGMGIERVKASIEAGQSPDVRTKMQALRDMRAKHPGAVPAVLPMNFDSSNGIAISNNRTIFPLSGISNKKVIFCNENGYFSTYESDRFGFNNDDNEWNSTVIDWLMLGDSFTHGACVHSDDNISGVVKKIKNGNESVINLGSAGNGPILELATLVEYAKSIKPKRILWFYYEGNDLIIDIKREREISILNQYLEQPSFIQNIIEKQDEIDKSLNEFVFKKLANEEFVYNSRLLRLYYVRKGLASVVNKIKNNANQIHESKINELDKEAFFAVLTRARDMTSEWGGRLYFIYLPSYSRYKDPNNIKHFKRLEILSLVESLNIPVVDMHNEVFDKAADPLDYFPYRLPGHYNEKGYSEIGKAIVRNIR